MRKGNWKKYLLALCSGSMMLQMPGCTEVFSVITGVATSVTAGGVIYLITRVLED